LGAELAAGEGDSTLLVVMAVVAVLVVGVGGTDVFSRVGVILLASNTLNYCADAKRPDESPTSHPLRVWFLVGLV